jgi:hypothetical protein
LAFQYHITSFENDPPVVWVCCGAFNYFTGLKTSNNAVFKVPAVIGITEEEYLQYIMEQ